MFFLLDKKRLCYRRIERNVCDVVEGNYFLNLDIVWYSYNNLKESKCLCS